MTTNSSTIRRSVCVLVASVIAALSGKPMAWADFFDGFAGSSYVPGDPLPAPWIPGLQFGNLATVSGSPSGWLGSQGAHGPSSAWQDADRSAEYDPYAYTQYLYFKTRLSSANGLARLSVGAGNSLSSLLFEMEQVNAGSGNLVAPGGAGIFQVATNRWYQTVITLTKDEIGNWSWEGKYWEETGTGTGVFGPSVSLGAPRAAPVGFSPDKVKLQSIYAFNEAGGTSALDDVGFGKVAPAVPVLGLDRGHRILLERGLQIMAGYDEISPGQLAAHAADFEQSKFTGRFLLTGGTIPVSDTAWGGQWGGVYPNFVYGTNYRDSQVVALQSGDEQNLADPTELFYAKNFLRHWRERFPNALGFTNQASLGNSVPVLRNYMMVAQPDILVFDHYGFVGDVGVPGETDPVLGGSPTKTYELMQVYRQLALAGNDGTGTKPIPYGRYLQLNRSFTGHVISGSEARLDQFANWAFGYTFSIGYLYSPGTPPRESVLVDQDWNPKPLFYQEAETNRQSLNLGPALVRLISTDIRFVRGQHKSGTSTVFNTLPAGISVWNDQADPYLSNITAQNLGTKNDGLKGDVLVGYFKPLHEFLDGDAFQDQIYFMILNGLSDVTGTVEETRQLIRISFDFGNTGIDSLQRLSRDTGLVEIVALIADGGGRFHLDLILAGGTGDLFKFNTGAPFVGGDIHSQSTVPEPTPICLLGELFALLSALRCCKVLSR